jgi:hypothetical protein
MSASAKIRAARDGMPDNTGKPAWNKATLDQGSLEYYRREIRTITERLYYNNKDVINPNNYPRGHAGQSGAYHIDHIISITEGFNKNIPIDDIASIDNLQMLPWRDNIIKSNKNADLSN